MRSTFRSRAGLVGTGAAVVMVLSLMAGGVATAWTGASTPTPVDYNGKDSGGMPVGYSLVYGSGRWTQTPSGAWSSIDIACATCGGTAWSIPDSGSAASPWSSSVTLPFTFTFFGQQYTSIKAHGYGMLGFGSPPTPHGNTWDELDYSSTGSASKQWAVIFAFQSSYSHAGCTGTNLAPLDHVKHKTVPPTTTGANDRVFVVQFTDVKFKNGGSCNMTPYGGSTYQVRLYESTNVIEVHYNTVTNQDPYGGADVDVGIRSSIPPAGSGSAPRYLRYTPLFLSGSPALRTASSEVVQYRPASGAVPTAIDDALTWDYDFGNTPEFTVSGFPTATTGTLFANDRSVGSASLQASYVSGSLTSGAQLKAGTSCTGTTPALATDGGFCLSTPGNADPCSTTWTFQYTVNDAWGVASAPATVTVNAINCDLAPIAGDDPHLVVATDPFTQYQVTEGSPRSVSASGPQSNPAGCGINSGVLCNDWDPDNIPAPPPATLSVNGPGARTSAWGGSVSLGADGAFTYTPANDFCGIDHFTYNTTDGIRGGNDAKAYLGVTCVSDAPTAVADSFTLPEDCSATPASPATACTWSFNAACPSPSAAAKGVLCNDTDPDTDDESLGGPNAGNTAGIGDAAGPKDEAIQCTGASQLPLHGTVALATDGSFTYSPDVDYSGPDAFWYRVRDPIHQGGFDTSCVQVALTVTAVSDVPVASDDDYDAVNVGSTTIPAGAGVLANDVNPDRPPGSQANTGLTVTAWGAVTCSPAATGMSISATGPAGGFTFTPPTNPASYVGTCSFGYTATNGASTASATAQVHVVDPAAPFAIDDTCSLLEDPSPTPWACAGNVFANDYVFPGTPGPTAFLDSPATIAGVGTLSLQPGGAYTFAPVQHWNGQASFRYRFTQDPGGGPQTSNSAFITIVVSAVNDPPTALPKSYACFPEDTPLSIGASAGLLVGASDVHGGAPGEGNLWTTYTPNRLRIVVPALPIDTAKGQVVALADDGSFVFVPDANVAGADSFTFQVQDAGGTAQGGQDTSVARTVDLCISPAPDPPVAQDDPGLPTGAYEIPNVIDLEIPVKDLLANDSDPDTPYTGETVQFLDFAFTAVPGSGNVLDPPAGGILRFQPGDAFVGTQTFQYRVKDPTDLPSNWATVTISVFHDQAPTAAFTPSTQSTVVGAVVAFRDDSADADDGFIGCWRWDFGDGSVSDEREPSHTYAAPGTYVVRLTVCDLYGVTSSATHVVVVGSVPQMDPGAPDAPAFTAGGGAAVPMAFAGEDQSVLEGDEVTLAGSALPVGVQSFQWRQLEPGPKVELRGSDTPTASFDAPRLEDQSPILLTFELRVTDAGATSAPDIVEVMVRPHQRGAQGGRRLLARRVAGRGGRPGRLRID